MGFEKLGLSEKVLEGITAAGYENPTPIQEQAVPIIINGKDVIGASQTGTGKTAAFALPILHKLEEHGNLRCLILEPVRELASQVLDNLISSKYTQRFLKFAPSLNSGLLTGLAVLYMPNLK